MCDKVLREAEKVCEKSDDAYCSQTAAKLDHKRRTLLDVKGYEKCASSWPSPLSTWCPRASMYYAHTEDLNLFDRIYEFTEIEKKNCSDHVPDPHFDPPLDPFTIRDPYVESDAREKYLRTHPTCFAIFGKPGLNSFELGKLISEWWKCVLISPESLVNEEIEKRTDKGRWIEEILKNGETLEPYVKMNLVESRVRKHDVMHRGYVVEGLPLIPDSRDPEYSSCPEKIAQEELSKKCCTAKSACRVELESDKSLSHSTISLISTEKPVSVASSSPFEEHNNTGDYSNLLDNAKRSMSLDSLTSPEKTINDIEAQFNWSHHTTAVKTPQVARKTDKTYVRVNPFENDAHGKVPHYEKYEDYVPDQIRQIFNDWPIKPTVIIYITCPDDDIVQRHANVASNSFAGEAADTTFFGKNANEFYDNQSKKHLLKHGSDVEATVKLKCEIYRCHALPVIDRYVLKQNPQNVIRVDGRTMVAQMFQIINAKLRTLPFSRAIIPQRIGNRVGWEADDFFAGEGDEDQFQNEAAEDTFENKSNEEIFEELSRKSAISLRLPWSLSNWQFTCPVELAQGRSTEGRAEHAVLFMSKIFFLSSAEAREIFLENPRPFLLPMRPRATCKVAVFGPRYSGKSELSNALARNFGANVLNVRELEKGIIDDRIEANVARAARKALGRVIADLKSKLKAEREQREFARCEALNIWLNDVKQIIKQLYQINHSDFSEGEEHSKSQSIASLHRKLRQYDLEILVENSQLLEDIKQDEQMLYECAPENLRFEEAPIRELTEHDPEVAIILENKVKYLRNEKIVVTSSELARVLISRIKMMPDLPLYDGLLREPGYILDGLYPDPEIWRSLIGAGVTIENLILVIEEQPYKILIEKWKIYNSTDEDVECHDNEFKDKNLRTSRLDRDIEGYFAEIQEFEKNWQIFRDVLEEAGKDPLICDVNKTSNLYEVALRHINDRYRLAAKTMTEEEREREFQDPIESVSDIDEEEELEGEEPRELRTKQVEKDNRRLGDTGIYCPVALAQHRVLWRGKEEHSALYLDKVYLCSNAKALDEFVKNPESFKVPLKKPMTEIPPARICIVGPPGSGKSTLAKMLSTEFKVTHVDFLDSLNTYVSNRGIIPYPRNEEEVLENIDLPIDLTDEKYNVDRDTILAFVRKYKKEGATLPQRMLKQCFLKFFRPPYDTHATIIDSFPNCIEDVEVAVENWAVPELVIEFECNLEKTQERLLPGLLDSFMKTKGDPKNLVEDDEEEEREEKEDEEDNDDTEEVKERILQEIEESYNRTSELLINARNRMETESVPWIKVNAEKNVIALCSHLKKIIHPLIFRKSSIFERTYDVNLELVEDLLNCGYYFLSSFGRSCPVQMYKQKIPIQLYLPMEDRDKIYPVLHRQYVYFIAGEDSLKLFTSDPLKYLRQDSCDPVIPAKISIIGPPKCGKSTIAGRFASAYGMQIITREKALHWIKLNYAGTKTGSLVEELLQSGQEVTDQLIARAVEFYLMEPFSSTQGYVLDGFPTNREEAEELILLNIRPMIVLNLQADEHFCLTSSTLSAEEKNKKSADYSPNLISDRYDTWNETSSIYLDWLKKFAQNVVDVDATRSRWAVWRHADSEVCSRFADIKRYFREADYEKVHCLKNLSVSPYEFRIHQSRYESYCPACLHYENLLKFSGSPPDRRGVVQFREYFYWICPKHLEIFTDNPGACLPPQSAAALPAERPQIMNEQIDVDHSCWAKRLQADGNCIVTYANALPEYKIVSGEPNIGVLYEDHLYLLCSLECREKFCSQPWMYSKIEIKYREFSPSVVLKNLPTVDFLEQTVADAVVKAVTEAAAARPKYPGLSPALSAAVYIGVYLKVHNVYCTLDEVGVYEEVRRRMDARYQITRVATQNMMKMINPHVAILNKVPAYLNVVDIAGLVKGAAEGQGLGNAFLSHISACDAIFHLCRAFEDDDVTHIEGEVNPVRDLEIISEELRLKDVEFLGVHLDKLEKLVVRGNDKKLKPEYDTVLKVKNILVEEKKHIRFADWSVNEIEILNKYLFLTSKPVIYLVNLSEKDYIRKKNKWLIKIKEWVDKNDPGASLIPFSGTFENKVIDMDEAERSKYFEESKVTSALDKIIVQGYKALQLQYFFTAGADEVKAWTIQKGTKAPQAAGRIHTDFEKGFIMAEVMKFDDFKNEGSEASVKAAGKYRQQGRNYVVEDGDIIFFKFNAGAGLKDPKKK